MYYITPITEKPYIKEQIKFMLADTSPNDTLSMKQQKDSKLHKICTSIETFLLVLFLLDVFVGFFFPLQDKSINIYHFINENIVPVIYLIAYLSLSVCKKYPNLASIKTNFYFRFYIFFLIYTAFCNILTSYHISGYILFLITGFGLAMLYLGYYIYTSGQALDSFIEATAKRDTGSKS